MLNQNDTLAEIQNLLRTHIEVLDRLKALGVIRTQNNPIGDYAEWLVANKLNLQLLGNSTAHYDAVDEEGVKYQIKCRRIASAKNMRQLSAIRNLDQEGFNFLIAVIFNHDFSINSVFRVPHRIISKYAVYRARINGHSLRMRGAILSDPDVENITELFV